MGGYSRIRTFYAYWVCLNIADAKSAVECYGKMITHGMEGAILLKEGASATHHGDVGDNFFFVDLVNKKLFSCRQAPRLKVLNHKYDHIEI